ncbi:hypothetical protein CW745_06850 [Psychromonas sp. psych-6C06]|uniref:hypothetical protein n=1 Tax=Psychromonas sp. psych-6C06 TaxID=2058089 RepID=UPI000C3381E3|nr:hypothetical protein [Psychromonas sp. psych-6C06]PKF63129.1 hypothetical protein CW745_06850 [Psychromonas sp. psych-6C06]
MFRIINLLLLILLSNLSIAMATENQPATLVDINIGIEMQKFEQSAQNIEHSITLASQALQEMAKNPNLNEAQQDKIIASFERMDALANRFQTSIETIPSTIKQSTPPVTGAINNLFSNIQLTIIIALVALLLLILGALVVVYYWVLKPSTAMLLQTTEKIDSIAAALQTTALIVEKNADQQLEILNHTSRKP